MQIETLPIDTLIPYARNSRTHSDEQVAQIAASIREFGFTNPVLIDADGGLIAGHGRVLGARRLGLAEVPCIRLAHLTEAQRRAYVIADNKLALNAGWDDEMLALELRDLHGMEFDLSLTGFENDDIAALLAGLGKPAPVKEKTSTGIEYEEKWSVLVECKGEAHQRETYDKLAGMGYACKVLVN